MHVPEVLNIREVINVPAVLHVPEVVHVPEVTKGLVASPARGPLGLRPRVLSMEIHEIYEKQYIYI